MRHIETAGNPNMTAVLAHLVGDQTLPNLLPIIAIKPKRVLQIRSGAKRFEASARNLQRSLGTLGISCECKTMSLISSSPLPSEVINAIQALPTIWKPTLCNLTGGTKLMSFGLQSWAWDAGVPALYVDTESQHFHSLGKVPLPEFQSLGEIATTLNLAAVLTAHGVPCDMLAGSAPSPTEIAFGIAAAAAWKDITDCRDFVRKIQSGWLNERGEPFRDPNGADIPRNAFLLAQAAVSAGWAFIEQGCFYPDVPIEAQGDISRRSRFIKDLIQTLEGGWFEILIAGKMLESPFFSDVRWSVEAPQRADLAMGETDVVALDRRNLSPVFVSCKSSTGFDKPLEHIFSLRQRAFHFGGTFARAVLCVSRVNSEDQEKTLCNYCRAANVNLLLGEESWTRWIANG